MQETLRSVPSPARPVANPCLPLNSARHYALIHATKRQSLPLGQPPAIYYPVASEPACHGPSTEGPPLHLPPLAGCYGDDHSLPQSAGTLSLPTHASFAPTTTGAPAAQPARRRRPLSSPVLLVVVSRLPMMSSVVWSGSSAPPAPSCRASSSASAPSTVALPLFRMNTTIWSKPTTKPSSLLPSPGCGVGEPKRLRPLLCRNAAGYAAVAHFTSCCCVV